MTPPCMPTFHVRGSVAPTLYTLLNVSVSPARTTYLRAQQDKGQLNERTGFPRSLVLRSGEGAAAHADHVAELVARHARLGAVPGRTKQSTTRSSHTLAYQERGE